MARHVTEPPTSVYMAQMTRTYPDGGVYHTYQGPYSTRGAAKARLAGMQTGWAILQRVTETPKILKADLTWEEME